MCYSVTLIKEFVVVLFMNLQFITRVFKHGYRSFAGYVPKNIIEFNKINPAKYSDASWHDGKISFRTSADEDWKYAMGYLGYYSSRNTLRVVFAGLDDESDLSGKLVEFKIENY